MNCSLCEKVIDNYLKELNRLVIDDTHIYEICKECIDKIMKWQQNRITNLFPTSALKKMQKKNQKSPKK